MTNKEKRIQKLEEVIPTKSVVVMKNFEDEDMFSCDKGKFKTLEKLAQAYPADKKFQILEIIWEENLKEVVKTTLKEFDREF